MASLEDDSALILVDVDPASSELGARFPVRWRFQAQDTFYLPANTLAVRTVEGLALRPKTTYALLVTNRVAIQSERFAEMLGDEAPEGLEEAWSIYAPLRDADLELDRLAVDRYSQPWMQCLGCLRCATLLTNTTSERSMARSVRSLDCTSNMSALTLRRTFKVENRPS